MVPGAVVKVVSPRDLTLDTPGHVGRGRRPRQRATFARALDEQVPHFENISERYHRAGLDSEGTSELPEFSGHSGCQIS